MKIATFLSLQSGGDLPATAVVEERCLKPPIGCGLPLAGEASGRDAEAARYQAEWRISGLCPDCQDRLDVSLDVEAGLAEILATGAEGGDER